MSIKKIKYIHKFLLYLNNKFTIGLVKYHAPIDPIIFNHLQFKRRGQKAQFTTK